jgi:hypothetical protein
LGIAVSQIGDGVGASYGAPNLNASQKECTMKAAIVFTGSGPIVVMTTFESFVEPRFVEKMEAKGIKKYIAYEVDLDGLKSKYGKHFDIILGDLKQSSDLRVLDYNGHRIFSLFELRTLGAPIFHEP